MTTLKLPRWTRQRLRADGSLRLWWEPDAAARKLGFVTTDLDPDKMAASIKQAQRLNEDVDKARTSGKVAPVAGRGRAVADLIASYRGTVHWREGLQPKTRKSYAALLDVIDRKWGGYRAAALDRPTMYQWYQTQHGARGARMAQALVRMMSTLMAHAEDIGWRPENSNPCLRLKIKTPAPRARVLTEGEIAALLASAEALGLRSVRLAILLSVLHGQRITDVLGARRDAFTFADWQGRRRLIWTFVRSKRKNLGQMVVHDLALPDLRAALAETGTATQPRLPTDPVIWDEAIAKPPSEDLFHKRWRAVVDHAATKGRCPSLTASPVQFRDLRRTFGALARAAGVDKSDIGDVLGNSAAVNPQLGETYMAPGFEAVSRAVSAVQLAQKKGNEG